jgi:hypothetical protein
MSPFYTEVSYAASYDILISPCLRVSVVGVVCPELPFCTEVLCAAPYVTLISPCLRVSVVGVVCPERECVKAQRFYYSISASC